jgi:pimeloyl-ACP methyl ester carboxylesterase
MPRIPSTDGVTLAVHDLGGEGPTLLLCHATGFHGMVWRPLAMSLLDAFHCWSIDFRGHGDSSSPDIDYDWDGFADDVLAVVDGLELERPFAVGHSKGGASLLLAEERRPGTFRAMWHYEPVVFPPDAADAEGQNPLAEGARKRREVFDSHEAAYANFASKPPLDVLREDALRAYVEHGFGLQPDGTVLIKCRAEHEARVYSMARHHHAFESLHMVRCPVVVARGRLVPGPAMVAEVVAEALPGGRLEVYEHLGHFAPMEDPDGMGAAARAFLLAAASA